MTDYFDSGREREFNTYYDAYRALSSTDPPYTNLFDAEAAARHEPRLASDPTLTAFCQLGALRLNTKRCMIFFFDQTNGYVLAESTQSHHSGHTQELWLGNTIIPRGLSVCEHTVNIPESNQGSNQDQSNAGDVHIINNFLEDERFCERPYVKDAPHARFYAGVPIATPSGARIGAYCVLDDAPRQGINDEDVDFLKHMASLVIHHLVILRESAEYGRGARMLQGLGVITRHDESTSPVEGMVDRVEDANTRRKTRNKNLAGSSSPPSSYTPMLSEYASDFAAETDSVSRNRQKSSQQQSRSSSSPPHACQTTATKTQSVEAATPEISAVQPPPLARASHSDESSSSYHTDGSVNDTLDKQIRKSFQRASSLLLEAVKSDGVVFLDATATKSASTHATSRRFSASSDCSTSESDGAHSSIAAPSVVNSGAKCGVLGHSEADGIGGVPSFDNMLTERFLKSLMRRYPKGKTWTFDANGKVSSEKFLQDLAGSIPQLDDSTSRDIAQTLRETPKLQRLFSLGLRTLCFAPMWDPVRERWYAAALTWSKSPQHGFSKTSELSYLNAFCDVTMAEILRIESKQEARSRAALMSSFSHDLRSPLHGILGSIDLLRGAGTLDWSLVEQVQKCSLNLVDVIDHLLDFAEINNKEQPRRTSDSGHDGKVDQLRPLRKVSSQRVSLSQTTEAIVDAVFYSHYFTKQDRTQPHVDLVLDLTPRSATQCMISVGAWKRLCTNIVNNALKYTPKGHVKVSLDITEHQNEDKHAVLTVSDTGIGMSQEFLQESLFKSFAQEDSFATGTGLGMSLVAELVKEFGGQIEVTSKKGEGTTMIITVPLDVPQETVEADTASTPDCSDICIGYLEPHEAQTGARSSRQMLVDTAKRTLRDIGVTVSDASDTGVVMILEEHFMQLPNEAMTGRQRWLVLCDSFASATRLREQHQGVNVEFVPQPYGPERLSTALQILCKSLPVQVETSAGSDSTVSGAIDRQMASLVQSRNRARSALPSPPLDVALDFLNLSSPNASTVKAATPKLEHIGTGKSAHKLNTTAVDSVARGPDVMATPSYRPASTNESSQPSGPLFLLLVDDNPINLKLLAMVADRNHYPRILATNGQEAVDAYKSPETATRPPQQSKVADQQIPAKRPDVVLLDLNMPIMNGFEAARQIRQYEKLTGATSPAVIVAITGLGDDIARAKAYQHGFDLFMSKPVRPKDVTDMLESIVKARESQND